MSMEETLIVVFNGLLKIQSLLVDTKEIEDFLDRFKKSSDGFNEGVNTVKKLVDQLYKDSLHVKDAFYKVYNKLIEADSKIETSKIETVNQSNSDIYGKSVETGNKDCSINGNVTVSDNSKLTNANVASTDDENIERNAKDTSEMDLDEDQPKNDNEAEHGDDADNIVCEDGNSKHKTNIILDKNDENSGVQLDNNEDNLQALLSDDNDSKHNEENKVSDLEADVIDSSILNDEDQRDKNNHSKLNNDSDNEKKPKAVIRLVDLSKLIDPKSKKNVRFNSSLIVISSDDEPNIKDQNSLLKSALNSRSKKERKSKIQIKHKKTSSDDNSDHKNSDKWCSSDHSDKNKKDSETSSENSDNESNLRSSSRLKSKQKLKVKTRERLRNVFKHRGNKKDTTKKEEKEDNNNTNRMRGSKQPKDKIEVISYHSSSSDEDVNEKKNQKRNKQNSDSLDKTQDKKLSCKVYVPLILIKCEKLKEVYLRNKEILEIKRLTSLKTLKRTRKANRSGTNNSSDEFEQPSSKKSMKKIPEKPHKSDDEMSLDDENISETDEKDSNKNGELVATDREEVADIVLEELNNLDGEKIVDSDGSNSEKEDDANKSIKKSKNEKRIGTKEKGDEMNDKQGEENSDCDQKDQDKNTDKLSEEESRKSDSGSNKDEKSDDENAEKGKKKWKSDKLLTEQMDSPDSDEDFSRYSKRKEISRKELMSDTELSPQPLNKRKVKKRMKKITVISDSDDSNKNKDDSESEKSDSSSSSVDSSNRADSSDSDQEAVKKKPVRRRIKRAKESSSDDDDDKSTRKHIRRVIDVDSLSETTKQAEADEKQRKARILEKQKKYNQILEQLKVSKVEKLILEYDEENKKDLLPVHKHFLSKMKPHQASGVRFMWDACYESLELAKKEKGGGCILAHCMGLGKTLQVIILSHTLLTNEKKTHVNRIMVVCPINTVLNWKSEFKTWLPKHSDIEIYELVSCKKNYERQYRIKEWHEDGGVLLIGYTMFRMLSNPDNKKISKKMRIMFQEGLVDPGPDLVVCDEGHLLKNEKSHLSIAMSRIKTQRRIVLTGTPLQNNLKEYWCMVQFIKPNLLGTYKEYMNRFVNPITNGQYTDSTQHDINIMRKRSHVLHKLLDGVVQRKDYSVLEPYLPPKHEYVIFIKLADTQIKMYKHYMDRFARRNDASNRTAFLFTDFQELQRICTHPRVLLDKSIERKDKEFEEDDSEGSLKDFIDDGDVGSSSTPSSSGSDSDNDSKSDTTNKKKNIYKKRVTRARAAERRENNEESDPELVEVRKQWWQEFCDGDELDNIKNSGKLFLLFEIIKECEEIGDKILVFSQSLYTLNCIEYFLEKIDELTQKGDTEKLGGYTGSWALGLDYFRIDGSSSCDNRATWCNMFNDPKNIRSRLFLISTKAGGLGINLVAANRVIIFDVSWNPSHDIQSIYRVYRFGQTKPCYVYRFVTYGTMEMKIYERQVIKQAISKRVIDEQQIDRHYNQNDIQELYKCDLEPEERPLPMVPKDVLLGEMLQKYEKTIYTYHLHQSLLENKECEELNEEERKAAWEEFENEKIIRKTYNNSTVFPNLSVNAQTIAAALTNIVKKDNPTWPDHQIKGIIPALVKQLQVQLSENDTSMYTRVQQEIQLMQAMQKQQMSEAYYQQQVLRMIQQQQARNAMLGNLNVNPASFNPGFFPQQFAAYNQSGPSSARPAPAQVSNVVIDLND